MAKKFLTAIQRHSEVIPLSFLETQAEIKSKLIILDELKNYIAPLTTDEAEGLENTLLSDGIIDPLIVWETSESVIGTSNDESTIYVLIDGHNRYSISQKHNLDYRIVLQNYESIDEVKEAMLAKQLNRRNLTSEQVSYYRGVKYRLQKSSKGGDVRSRTNTAEALAKEYGVTEKTIKRDAEFALGLDNLTPQLRNEILSGKGKISKKQIQTLANVSVAEPIDSYDKIQSSIPKQKEEYSPVVLDEFQEIKTLMHEFLSREIITKTDFEDFFIRLKSIKENLA